MQTLLPNVLEYDLNVFYVDDPDIRPEDDVLWIQPSAYKQEDGNVTRQYLKAHKLSLLETRAIAPDFPVNDYGSDFFIGLDYFMDKCLSLPQTIAVRLSMLPPLDEIEFGGPEIFW